MDKRVIFAVAGSGKTTHIVNHIDLAKRSLIIIYTLENVESMRRSITERFGYFPDNIRLMSYFSFLYDMCYKPLLSYTVRAKGLIFTPCPDRYAKGDDQYISPNRYLYSNRLAKFFDYKEVTTDIVDRLERYFDTIYIDEVQDVAGNDFNFLKSIAGSNLNLLLVGDYFQHTYDTSRDGPVNRTLHADLEKYVAQFEAMGITTDFDTLSHSHRCSPSVCEYVQAHLGIPFGSHRENKTEITYVDNQDKAEQIFKDDSIVKLFYDLYHKYPCYSNNWGKSKGNDNYKDVCIVLNKTTLKFFQEGKLNELAVSTRNKLYVALSRARGDVFFVPHTMIDRFRGA